MARYTRRYRRYSRGSRKYYRRKTSYYRRKYRVARWGRKSRRSFRSRSSPRNWSIKSLKYWLKRKSALRSFGRKERSKAKQRRQWHRMEGGLEYKRLGRKMLKSDSDQTAVASRHSQRYLYRLRSKKAGGKATWVSVGVVTNPKDIGRVAVRELTNAVGQFLPDTGDAYGLNELVDLSGVSHATRADPTAGASASNVPASGSRKRFHPSDLSTIDEESDGGFTVDTESVAMGGAFGAS